jgi:radical SAM-linked protein
VPGPERDGVAGLERDGALPPLSGDAGSPPGGRWRLRVRYAKTGRIRFTSHRDVVRMWERALRRSGLPVAWSEGFSPRPLVSFGLALPTGAESLAEYLDVVLEPLRGGDAGPAGDLAALARQLSDLVPEGLDVQAVATVPDGSGSLQEEVSSCSWKLEVHGLAAQELASRVERLLAAPNVLIRRERKGRTVYDDLRPSVLALAVADGSPSRPGALVTDLDAVGLHADLATRPRGVRPRELLEGLGTDVELSRACRMHQWIERDGARWEPLDCGPAPVAAPHATERAS